MLKTVIVKITSFIITISLLFSGVFLLSAEDNQFALPDETTSDKSQDREKVYCKATVNDEFAEDSLLIVMNRSSSKINRKLEISSFKETNNINEITDLTYSENYITSEEYNENEEFYQILKVELKNKGKQIITKRD